MDIEKRKQKVNKKFELWQEQKQLLIKEEQIKQEKREIKQKNKEERKKLTTSKLLMFFLFISCSVIQAVTIILTIKTIQFGCIDFSALQTLIATVVAEVISYAVYSLKALKENTKGGIVYQTAMLQNSWKPINEEENNDQDEDDEEALG